MNLASTGRVGRRDGQSAESFAGIVELVTVLIVEGDARQKQRCATLDEVLCYECGLPAAVLADFETETDFTVGRAENVRPVSDEFIRLTWRSCTSS